MGHKFSFCQGCEDKRGCDSCGKLDKLEEAVEKYLKIKGVEVMNKPVRLWTNEENVEYCKRRRNQPIVCSHGCELYRAGICRVSSPYNWQIGPAFTQEEIQDAKTEEIQDAKTIAKLFPGAGVRLRKKENGEFCISFHATVQIPGEDIAPMELRFGKVDIFPNLKPGESVTLDEVIGGGE